MKLVSLIAIFASSLFIFGCGEDSSSAKDVEFEHLIEQPVVIDADFVISPGTDDEIVLPGPWVPFQYKFVNGSAKFLTVAAIEFTIRAQTSSGFKTVETTYDTNSTCASGAGRPFVVPNLAPGSTFIGMQLSDCTTPRPTDGSSPAEIVILYGLPDAVSDINSITVTAIGWFSDAANDVGSEKFQKQTFFVTQ